MRLGCKAWSWDSSRQRAVPTVENPLSRVIGQKRHQRSRDILYIDWYALGDHRPPKTEGPRLWPRQMYDTLITALFGDACYLLFNKFMRVKNRGLLISNVWATSSLCTGSLGNSEVRTELYYFMRNHRRLQFCTIWQTSPFSLPGK